MRSVGIVVWFIGVLLIMGNLSGLFRTFPYCGFIVTLIGAGIVKSDDSSGFRPVADRVGSPAARIDPVALKTATDLLADKRYKTALGILIEAPNADGAYAETLLARGVAHLKANGVPVAEAARNLRLLRSVMLAASGNTAAKRPETPVQARPGAWTLKQALVAATAIVFVAAICYYSYSGAPARRVAHLESMRSPTPPVPIRPTDPAIENLLGSAATPPVSPADPSLAGIHPDLQTALAEAKKAGRLLLVDFYGGWCPWCVKMDAALEDADVKKILDKQFFYYKLDVGHFEEHQECFHQYKGTGVPLVIVFNHDGSVRDTLGGYVPPRQFVEFLSKAAGEPKAPVSAGSGAGKVLALDFSRFRNSPDAIMAAVRQAATQGRRLIVYFYEAETLYHRLMEDRLRSAGELPNAASFCVMRIPRAENEGLAAQYGCTSSPFLIIFCPDGTVSDFFVTPPREEEFDLALRKAAAQR